MKTRMTLLLLAGLSVLLFAYPPPVVDCPCDHARPETLAARVCGLCRTAEQSGSEDRSDPENQDDLEFYFLKDLNPHKPNRHLALPRRHRRGLQSPASLPHAERARYWRAAITRARQLYGDRWGLAANGYFFRTQCHAHIHIGPLSPQVADTGGELHDDPAGFPSPGPEQGMWVHPKEGRYCVHRDRDLAEVVLVR